MSAFGGFEPKPGHHLTEQIVIGAMIATSAKAMELLDIAGPETFWNGRHVLIAGACSRLAADGKPVDPATVLTELSRSGEAEKAGGGPYLYDCMAVVPAGVMAAWHAEQVAADAARRSLHIAALSVAQQAASADFSPEDGFEWARERMEPALGGPGAAPEQDLRQIAASVLDGLEGGEPAGIGTGILDLDELLGRLSPGQLIVVGARPGVGKSVLGLGIAAHAALDLGLPSVLSTMEMTAEEVLLRLYSARARIPFKMMRDKQVTDPRHWDRLRDAYDQVCASPIVIDDTPRQPVARMRSRLRAMARTAPAAVLVVDYLGLLREPAKAENRQLAIDTNTRALKDLAGEMQIPVVVLAQVNRESDKRADKRPLMSDLRESGAIEAHADVVILLDREDMRDRESPRAGEIDLIVAKNRQGAQGQITAAFQGHYARIVDMAAEWSPSSQAVA